MMTKTKLEELRKDGKKALEAAQEVSAKAEAEGRAMTTREQSDYDTEMKIARGVLAQIKQGQHDLDVIEQARDLAREVGEPSPGGYTYGAADIKGKRLSFGPMGAKVAQAIRGDDRTIGGRAAQTKALATSGTVIADQEFGDDPVTLGKPVNNLLDLLPVRRHSIREYAYLRQSVRTNNAALVADGAVKPTSVYTVVRIEDKLDVYAHLSEAVPRYWLDDSAALEQFMRSELEWGLRLAVETMALADINATSGIQTQAYATSPLVTIRKSLTKLETTGYEPAAIVLAPADWEALELALSSDNAIEYRGLPYDAASRRLYGVPVAVVNVQAAGVSHVLAKGAVELDTDSQGVQVTWSETSNADDWSKNLIRARCEGRFGTSIFTPLGVVVGDLTA